MSLDVQASGLICLEHVPNATDAANYCVAVVLTASRIIIRSVSVLLAPCTSLASAHFERTLLSKLIFSLFPVTYNL